MNGAVRHRKKKLDSTAVTVILVVVAAIAVRIFVLDAAVVEGKSMLPHYRNGKVVLILKAAYGIRGFWETKCFAVDLLFLRFFALSPLFY
jgi:signal peptidase I